MFDLERFSEDAENGRHADTEGLLAYIKSFRNIILWGAGNLGKAVGEKLISEEVKITAYWDVKYKENATCLGVPVLEPFGEELDRENTFFIPCIVNGSLGGSWTKQKLEARGYRHQLSGMILYEGLICPLNKDYFNIRECTDRKACSLCNCERYINLLHSKNNQQNELTFQLMTWVITTRCTLNCRYCGQRLSEYKPEEKKDFQLENIKRDIDNFSEAVDFVGMVSIIGGEPFVHPKLAEVVRHCLTKQNFGMVNITTNGIVRLTDEILQELKDDRVKISFSVYDTYLTDQQKELLENNIELVKRSGISCGISHPLWIKPCELKDYGHGKTVMTDKRQRCNRIIMTASIRDGTFYVCHIAESIETLHKFSAGNAAVDVKDKENLRERLFHCVRQEYNDCCRYCDDEAEEIIAGEQIRYHHV